MGAVEALVTDYLDLLWSDGTNEPGPVASDHAPPCSRSRTWCTSRPGSRWALPTRPTAGSRWRPAARRMADEIAQRFVFPPDSSRTSFLRAAIGEWARGRPEWADPDPAQLKAFLRPADIPYRERRLMFLFAGLCALCGDVGAGPDAPLRPGPGRLEDGGVGPADRRRDRAAALDGPHGRQCRRPGARCRSARRARLRAGADPGRRRADTTGRGGGWAARLTGPGALPHAPTSRRAAAGPLVVAALAGLAHLVVGYCYAVGGLVIPGYVLIALWLFWAALA